MVFPDYPGHFPGEPLVPGAALLDWVARETEWRGFERVRFVAPVRPGEDVALEVRGNHFTITRGAEVVAHGVGIMGPS